MSVTDNLNARLRYRGGNAEGRFINDKLTSLKRSLLYSYQACTAIIKDREPNEDNYKRKREFRCLINPDKLKADYDIKILSIPFHDVPLYSSLVIEDEKGNEIEEKMLAPMPGPLHFDENGVPQKTSDGGEEIGIQCGDVFEWKETGTHWLVLLRHLEEDAYFRAEIRRCDQQVEVDGKPYWTYIRGPIETSIQWNQKKKVLWNNLNYSLVMYITKDSLTEEYFHRFSKVKIEDHVWQVAAVDPYYYDGIIEVMLDEAPDNSMEEDFERPVFEDNSEIIGENEVEPYEKYTYTYAAGGGEWFIDAPFIKVVSKTETSIDLEIMTGRAHEFFYLYYKKGDSTIEKRINIIVF